MLETARMRLLPWQPEDWLLLRPLAADPLVMRYISDGKPWPDERIREFVGRQIGHFDRLGYCLWKLQLKETSAMIGFCGLQPLAGTAEIEIGWWLAQGLWGKGAGGERGWRRKRQARCCGMGLGARGSRELSRSQWPRTALRFT